MRKNRPVSHAEKYARLDDAKPAYFIKETSAEPIPAPVGGWDAKSPLANMPPENAITLRNWVSRPGYVELRGGYSAWVQSLNGSTSPVQSLMVYRPPNGSERLFGAIDDSIIEVSENGVQTVSKTGLAGSSIWQYINYTPAGGNSYLVICNGVNAVLNFNGTAWTTPSITGFTSANAIQVHSHMRRIWFVEVNTTKVWYLAVDAVAGAATALDVGPFLTKGSYVNSVGTWTVDGGNGPQALFVVYSNKGQAVIYSGQDPSNATTWTLVGVFNLPTPIGRRCMIPIGSDLGIITLEGLIPISKALPFNPSAARSVAFTDQIQNAMNQAAQNYSSNFGWEAQLFVSQTLMIMNVPLQTNNQQNQFVMNTITQKWSLFTGWNANCFAIFNENLFFGDNSGNVNLAYAGRLDGINSIDSLLQCAFNYFQSPGRLKHLNMLKAYFIGDGTLTPTISINVDFGTDAPNAPVTIGTPSGAVWDQSAWDQSTWSTGTIAFANWQSTEALGTTLSINMGVNYGATSQSLTGYGFFDYGVFDTAIFDGTGASTYSGQNVPILQLTSFLGILQAGGPI